MPVTLPELIRLDEYGGDGAAFIEAVYQVFRNDFVLSKPSFRRRNIGLKRLPIVDGKICTFYHITHEGEDEQNRTPDIRRCERIRWLKSVIERCDEWGLKVWEQIRKSEARICIWLERDEEPDYVVILADRKTYVLLWTTFVLTRDHEKNKKQKEYDAYKKAEAAKQGLTAS
ncbi:MAG: hypothetical protein V1799_13390 [bacterium]